MGLGLGGSGFGTGLDNTLFLLVRDLELECGIEGDLGPGHEAVWARLGGTRASVLGDQEELLAVWGEGEGVTVYQRGVEANMIR